MVPGNEQRYVLASDGTKIGYQVRGQQTQSTSKPSEVLVLANGLGGTYLAFQHVYKAVPHLRVICWDYRGLYSSSPSPDPNANTVAHQVSDLMRILEVEGVDNFAMAGWSMGVQVCLETMRAAPQRVKGLMLINGTYGKAFGTVLGSRLIGRTIPTLLKLVKAQSGMVEAVTGKIAGTAALVKVMVAAGMVSKTIDIEIFREVAAGFRTIDFKIYSDLLNRLNEHDASDVMPSVLVPTTVVTGDKDILTPPRTATEIHDAIAGSRLTIIAGGTHYTPVEYPAEVQAEVRAWLAGVPGFEPARSTT
jgi:pimeloyl-ACP methyl ester carboxylesterase